MYNKAMPADKYTATWVSHSSISDFLSCPRAYYLKNVYKDPKTGHKMQLMSPPLALGQAVHEVIESLSVLETNRRFDTTLLEKFDKAWQKVAGKKGGFPDADTEAKYKRRGVEMLRRVANNPGPLKNLAVKIQMDLPWFWLSEEDNLILCGKIDWLEYLQETDGVHIIDFKTGSGKENEDSLQLPIYLLLASRCQKHSVEKASYWYIEQQDTPIEKELPDLDESLEKVLKVAKKIKLARQLESFNCPSGGCRTCLPYEKILNGKGERVGNGTHGQDIYVLGESAEDINEEGVIL